MEASSSSSSLNRHTTSNSIHDRLTSKSTLNDAHELEELPITPHTKAPLRLRLKGTFEARFPRAYRVVLYLRGPRPKADLPDPIPLLDIDVTVKGNHLFIPIESNFIRYTRFLSNPWLFALLAAAYIISLAFFAREQAFLTPADSFISCTSAYWLSNNGCGMDGTACGPFNGSSFDFRCPAQCSNVILQNPRTVGNQQMVFKPLIVGGGDELETYRGDTFICAAAVQAGVISDSRGGCATLSLIGNHTNFLPRTSNGLSSIGFDSVFPLSWRFLSETTLSHCKDLRNEALAFNILITCFIFLLRPSSIVKFWSIFAIGFWHVTLFSQPRASPPIISDAFGTFLPALFIAYGFWRLAIRFVLPKFSKAPIESMVLYLGPFWVGVLFNLTFEKLPLDRLTAGDLKKRSGAIATLAVVLAILTVIVVNQLRVIRKTGWLPHYAMWYAIGGLVVLVLALLPGLQLRIHHYILGMVFMPGTAFPTRLSAIYQGFLLGIFVNGAAAYDFDSILQTAAELRRDAPLGSELPTFLTNSSTFNASISFVNQTLSWESPLEGWDGYSLLVDDVERYAGTALNYSLAALNATIPHFFRLAFKSGESTGDFTMAATLWPNGTWDDPLPGPS